MDIIDVVADQERIHKDQVSAVVQLLNDGNTVPFIARYRKEATGSLDEQSIRQIQDSYEHLISLNERRQTVLKSIEEQGKLDKVLKMQILNAKTRTELEDLYQPYKPKRKTKASIARERGLQPLADAILDQPLDDHGLDELVHSLLIKDKLDSSVAYQGAQDIIAEMISDHPEVRARLRQKVLQWGIFVSRKIDQSQDPTKTFEIYYEFECRANRLKPYQILAVNRGEKEKILNVSIRIAERDWREAIFTNFRLDRRSPLADKMIEAAEDSARRLLLPAIERDVRRKLTEQANAHAIHVFSENLRNLLVQPPILGHTVLGIDPGFRTGCKIAVVDPTGKLMETATIYPHAPQKAWEASRQRLVELIDKYGVTVIAIGNGTASRETESLAADITSQRNEVQYIIVSEAGASVYSASPLARKEFPDLDVSLRGAVSIARRLQDPLAELVKIDPKSIGVGMYQYDVDQQTLASALNATVESVVNQVGVDINTASPALFGYVSGIGPKLAEKLVAYRDDNGRFEERPQLLAVPGLGPKAYEQAAGFIRIRNGRNPLDETAIHPESYAAAEKILELANLDISLTLPERAEAIQTLRAKSDLDTLSRELQIGKPTLLDIFEQLVRPGRDPREDLPAPILRSDILSMENLQPGQVLMGTVRNVVDFGVFIDIGVKQDGLLHASRIPHEVQFKVGDVIPVRILAVDVERGRISLGYSD
jgi:uncharacterized protein